MYINILLVAASASSLADERMSAFVIAGVEGTGHHFWNAVGSHLQEMHPLTPPQSRLRMGMAFCESSLLSLEDIYIARAGFTALSSSKADYLPCSSRGCARSYREYENATCRATEEKVRYEARALYVPGCSYPCGSPQAPIAHVSPDLVRFAREAGLHGVRVLAVVMIREPVSTVSSSYYRRHQEESSFRATAWDLFVNMGYLDFQLRTLGEDRYALTYYENIVLDSEVPPDLADFLRIPHDELVTAVRRTASLNRRRGKQDTPQQKVSASDRLYVENLFYKETHRQYIPTFWPAFRVYKHDGFFTSGER